MKVRKFKEINESRREENHLYIKIKFEGEDSVSLQCIKNTDAYNRELDNSGDMFAAIGAGIEEYIYQYGIGGGFSYKVVDYYGNEIPNDEIEERDKQLKRIDKFNV